MTQYHEKFLEAEEKATQLLDQLVDLKKSSDKFKISSENLDKIHDELSSLIEEQITVVKAQQKLIQVLNEIGTNKIIDELDLTKAKLDFSINKQSNTNNKFTVILFILILLSVVNIVLVVFIK